MQLKDLYAQRLQSIYIYMYVCTYVGMYVRTYVCMYVCMYTHIRSPKLEVYSSGVLGSLGPAPASLSVVLVRAGWGEGLTLNPDP